MRLNLLQETGHRRSVWAIGDIHGQAELLQALLAALPRRPGDFTVFLGDYLDRGPESRTVVDRVLKEYDLSPETTILLWGNHEAVAARYFGVASPIHWPDDTQGAPPKSLLPTLISFGLSSSGENQPECPASLIRLFSLLRTYWRCTLPGLEHVVWVHAGVPPGQQPEDATAEDLISIRKEFTEKSDTSGRLVIFGHTAGKTVLLRSDKIGIDTGAGHGGPLSALELPARRLFKAYPNGRVSSFPLLSTSELNR
jgi:serine/threonine protein phosphatase 1